jgi:hypothetical protein
MKKPNRPSDPMQLAKYIADIATGAITEKKDNENRKVKKATKKREHKK